MNPSVFLPLNWGSLNRRSIKVPSSLTHPLQAKHSSLITFLETIFLFLTLAKLQEYAVVIQGSNVRGIVYFILRRFHSINSSETFFRDNCTTKPPGVIILDTLLYRLFVLVVINAIGNVITISRKHKSPPIKCEYKRRKDVIEKVSSIHIKITNTSVQ